MRPPARVGKDITACCSSNEPVRTSATKRLTLRAFLTALGLLSGVAELFAERPVTLQLSSTGGFQIQIAWQSQSVVPAPGLAVFPDYQLHKSTDLKNWTAIGERFAGDIGGASRRFLIVDDLAGQAMAFYRVESIVELPNADLIGEDLAQADFSGGNLLGADLFNASLHHANLRSADLSGADLRFANLTNADLRGARLFAARVLSADLAFADLKDADLSFANLDGAGLFAATLRGADLRFCVLSDADLRFTELNETKLDEHTLIDSKWKTVWEIVNQGAAGRNLQRADLSFSNISEADLRQADLRLADLTAAFAVQSDFSGANLLNANLRFIDLHGARFDTNTVVDAKSRWIWRIVNEGASGSDLHGLDFSSAILTEGNLSGAILTGVSFNLSFLNFANLSGADLTGASLLGADLTSANLSGANLTRANLRDANITNTDFSGAVFSNTIMPDGSTRSD